MVVEQHSLSSEHRHPERVSVSLGTFPCPLSTPVRLRGGREGSLNLDPRRDPRPRVVTLCPVVYGGGDGRRDDGPVRVDYDFKLSPSTFVQRDPPRPVSRLNFLSLLFFLVLNPTRLPFFYVCRDSRWGVPQVGRFLLGPGGKG